MRCKVDGCEKGAMYTGKRLCQMHYFRFMRNGSYDVLPTSRIYRRQNPAGYQKIFEPNHKLSNGDGYVYEHRMVYHDQIDDNPKNCSICHKSIDWQSLHIDHIDDDVTNNCSSNLRATCRACNTMQGHSATSYGRNIVTLMGFSLPAHTWARHPECSVSGTTILRRIRSGVPAFESVFNKSKTLKEADGKEKKAKYDDVTGVSGVFDAITKELERINSDRLSDKPNQEDWASQG